MKNSGRVIVEVGYYEVNVRPAKKGEKGQRFIGAGGLFTHHTNLFNSVGNFIRHAEKMNFYDSISYHKDLESEVLEFYGDVAEIQWTEDGERFYF